MNGFGVLVRVRSPYHLMTWPFSACAGGMKAHDDHLLIRVARVCPELCLPNPTFHGTPLMDISFGAYYHTLLHPRVVHKAVGLGTFSLTHH